MFESVLNGSIACAHCNAHAPTSSKDGDSNLRKQCESADQNQGNSFSFYQILLLQWWNKEQKGSGWLIFHYTYATCHKRQQQSANQEQFPLSNLVSKLVFFFSYKLLLQTYSSEVSFLDVAEVICCGRVSNSYKYAGRNLCLVCGVGSDDVPTVRWLKSICDEWAGQSLSCGLFPPSLYRSFSKIIIILQYIFSLLSHLCLFRWWRPTTCTTRRA